MSPTLNESSAIRRFEPSDTIKICNRMFFDFYTGLPQILLCHVFQVHQWVWRAIALNFCQGQGSYVLCKHINIWYAYEAYMNPAPSGSLALQCVKTWWCAWSTQLNNICVLFGTATYWIIPNMHHYTVAKLVCYYTGSLNTQAFTLGS